MKYAGALRGNKVPEQPRPLARLPADRWVPPLPSPCSQAVQALLAMPPRLPVLLVALALLLAVAPAARGAPRVSAAASAAAAFAAAARSVDAGGSLTVTGEAHNAAC